MRKYPKLQPCASQLHRPNSSVADRGFDFNHYRSGVHYVHASMARTVTSYVRSRSMPKRQPGFQGLSCGTSRSTSLPQQPRAGAPNMQIMPSLGSEIHKHDLLWVIYLELQGLPRILEEKRSSGERRANLNSQNHTNFAETDKFKIWVFLVAVKEIQVSYHNP